MRVTTEEFIIEMIGLGVVEVQTVDKQKIKSEMINWCSNLGKLLLLFNIICKIIYL